MNNRTEDLQSFMDSERPRIAIFDELPILPSTGRRVRSMGYMHTADIAVEDGRIIKSRVTPDDIGRPLTEEEKARALTVTIEMHRAQTALMKSWAASVASNMIAGHNA